MKLNNIHGFKTVDEYVKAKLSEYSAEEKSFETLFRFMFSEEENVMAELSEGYRIKKITYGEFKARILAIAPTLADKLSELGHNSIVGIYMSNSVEWLEIFWATLISGYRPLLMNTRLPDEALERLLSDHAVGAVISDGKKFSVKTLDKTEVAIPSQLPPLSRPFGTEVIFMSSGTTESIKLCAYTGENFYYQICDSINIIERCPKIKEHCDGELKQLALLPFYHVFGFIAVYLWFGFFSRTFVFPKDLNPITIQNTVKAHRVTHIFAVPMVWESVHKAVVSKVKARGAGTYRKLQVMIGLVNKLGGFGDKLARRFLSEVREGLFGDSIRFLITGGSHIAPETLSFFNGIGYHLANGYGMTEIGITSVEFSSNKKMLNSATIGAPFGNTEYSVKEDGTLLVRGKTMASRITVGKDEHLTDFSAWFETKDLARCEGGRYFIEGRADDLIVCESGENLNPTLAENALSINGVDRLCILRGKRSPVLLLSTPRAFLPKAIEQLYRNTLKALRESKLEGVIQEIYFTPEPLISGNEFKVSRRKIAKRFAEGTLRIIDPKNLEAHVDELLSGLEAEIRACFAEALECDPDRIGSEDNFFADLGGSSLDYFALLGRLKSKFGFELPSDESQRLATVKEIYEHINKGETV
ncbi:MAG: AMP-binding protein [Clostridia bacterium]|nr:AMP-binding protein [Clostridia bacterium]